LCLIKELESWQFQFAATPKFQLAIASGQFKLDLTVQNGLISSYELKFSLVEMDSVALRTGLDCLLNTRLKLDDLNRVFTDSQLLQIDTVFFGHILNYFNKNLS